jgi:hypothetical protein
MTRPWPLSLAAAIAYLCIVVLESGCGFFSSDTTSPSAVATVTETFSGMLAAQVSSVFVFSVTNSGPIAVTLAALGPTTTVPVGLGIGTSTIGATTCTPTSSTPTAIAGSSPQITIDGQPGAYCVDIHNVGSVTTASTFTITIVHS